MLLSVCLKGGLLLNIKDYIARYPAQHYFILLENGTEIEAKAGDIVIFHYQLVHASFPNKSVIPRRMFLLQVDILRILEAF